MLRLERWLFSSGSQSCMCFRRSTLSHLCLPSFRSGVGRCFSLVIVFARSKALRTGPSFCRNGPFFVMFWSRKHIQLGNSAPMSFRHLRSGPSTVSCVLLRRTCLWRTPPHYSRSAHQCAGRAVYFAAAKYGKAGRPLGVATLVAVRGLVPPK